MALKIRLRQQGRNNRPFYRLVVADERSPRDGKFIETIGWYNPFETEQEKHVSIKIDRIQHWLDNGAQLTEAAEVIVKKLAPQIIEKQTEKLLKKKAKFAEKRRARRKAAKATQKK